MTSLNAFLLGVAEGITEFLPVSSTGHLLLTARLLGVEQTEFLKTFEIAIQGGAILSVLFFCWNDFLRSPAILLRVCVAFVPTAVLGFLLHDVVRRYLLESLSITIWALFLGGLLLILFEKLHRPGSARVAVLEKIPLSQAALIGLCQAVAFVPGVSRAGATIVGGLLLGWERQAVVRFSFLLAVPTMLAAMTLDLGKGGFAFTASELRFLLVGFVTAFLTAMASIHWLLGYIRIHTFIPFGVYRVCLALVFWATVL